MSNGMRRPRFYITLLIVGLVVGSFLTALLARFLPDSAAKEIFTFTLTPTVGPISLDLLVISFTLGPVGLHISVLSLIGAALAHFVARSLF